MDGTQSVHWADTVMTCPNRSTSSNSRARSCDCIDSWRKGRPLLPLWLGLRRRLCHLSPIFVQRSKMRFCLCANVSLLLYPAIRQAPNLLFSGDPRGSWFPALHVPPGRWILDTRLDQSPHHDGVICSIASRFTKRHLFQLDPPSYGQICEVHSGLIEPTLS